MTDKLAVMLNDETAAIAALAPKYVSVPRLLNLAVQAVSRDQNLAKCTEISIVKFCKTCAEWGTDQIGAGGVWPVAFGKELVPIPDWRFMIAKAKNAKAIKQAFAESVHENDTFRASRGMYPNLEHEIAHANRGDVVGVYCVIVLPDDSRDFTYMEWSEVEVIRDRAPAGRNGPWQTDPIQMALKTVIKRALKPFEGESPELAQIMKADNVNLGYIDVTPEPVAMPTALPPKTETPPPAAKKPAGKAPAKPKDEPEGDSSITFVAEIDDVVHKKSRKDAKKSWERWGVKVDGTFYGTFDKNMGECATECLASKIPVEITAEKDGDFWNITSIEAALDAQQEPDTGESTSSHTTPAPGCADDGQEALPL
jgi:phage RecT family recombinase